MPGGWPEALEEEEIEMAAGETAAGTRAAKSKGETIVRKAMDNPARIDGRHAFAHERVLVFIALETRLEGAVRCSKREVAEMLGVNLRTVDRAVMRLRATGEIESVACHTATGAQVGNEYRATEDGLAHADELIARAFAVKG